MVHFAYMPSPIPRQVRWKFVRSYIPSTSAFPETGAGRLLHHYFRGLLSVHLRYGLHARQVAFATLCTRGFSSLVASPAALIATGWSEPVPGRVYPRCGPAPSRRTRFARHPSQWTARELREAPVKNYRVAFSARSAPTPSAISVIERTKNHFTFTRFREACILTSVLPHGSSGQQNPCWRT
jgi:hypothetical protein